MAELACRTALSYSGRVAHHHPGRLAGHDVNDEHALQAQCPASCVQRDAHERAAAGGAGSAAGGGDAERGQEDRDPGGPGRAGRGDELEQIAEKLGAPVIKALLGKGCAAGRQPVYDRRHRPAGHQAVARRHGGLRHAADRGQLVPLHRVLSEAGQARGVQIDLDPMRIGLRFPVEVGLVGDSQRDAAGAAAIAEAQREPRVSWKRRKPACGTGGS